MAEFLEFKTRQISAIAAPLAPVSTRDLEILRVIVEHYPKVRRPSVDSLMQVSGAAAGFSGGGIWCGRAPCGKCALRRWPMAYPAERIAAIGAVRNFFADRGFCEIAPVWKSEVGELAVTHDGDTFELSPWLEGEAERSDAPNQDRIRSATRLLGRFHRVGRTFPSSQIAPHIASPALAAAMSRGEAMPSGGLLHRQATWRRIYPPLCDAANSQPRFDPSEQRNDLARRTHAIAVRHAEWFDVFAKANHPPVELALCLRDVHREHVLFTGEEVTGLIDFGALGVDSPACDLARMLGSLVPDRDDLWQLAFAAYAEEHTLGDEVRRLAKLFDVTGAVLGAMRWFEWLILEQRRFPNPNEAVARWTTLLERIERWPTPIPIDLRTTLSVLQSS